MIQLDSNKDLNSKNNHELLIVLLSFVGFVLFSSLGGWGSFWIAGLYDVDISSIISGSSKQSLDFSQRQAIRWSNLLPHIFGFTISTLVIVSVFIKKPILQYLGLDAKFKTSTFFWSIVTLLLVFPAIQFVIWLNLQLPLPDWLAEIGQNQDWLVAEVLTMEKGRELVFVLLVAAVVPAFGEELLFRGLLQKQFSQLLKNPHWGVWITAILFSAIHMQFAGFFPRMFLGVLLGYLYFWSASLWLPILIHFLFNGIQVLASYLFPEIAQSTTEVLIEPKDYLLGIGALLLLFPVLFKLYRSTLNPAAEQE